MHYFRMIALGCGLLLSQAVLANTKINNYAQSLKDYFGISPTRLNQVASKINFAVLRGNRNAAATYHPAFNRLSLEREAFSGSHVKSLHQFRRVNHTVGYVQGATIFHEMGHAEHDVFINTNHTRDDQVLRGVLNTKIKKWFQTHHRRANSTYATGELFGYYRGAVFEAFYDDMETIIFRNGYNKFKKSCFKTNLVKEALQNSTKEEFLNFLAPKTWDKYTVDYGKRIRVDYVFVNGRDYEIYKSFRPEWFEAIWDHFSAHYRPPQTPEELLGHMNKSFYDLKEFKACRLKLWEEHHGQ